MYEIVNSAFIRVHTDPADSIPPAAMRTTFALLVAGALLLEGAHATCSDASDADLAAAITAILNGNPDDDDIFSANDDYTNTDAYIAVDAMSGNIGTCADLTDYSDDSVNDMSNGDCYTNGIWTGCTSACSLYFQTSQMLAGYCDSTCSTAYPSGDYGDCTTSTGSSSSSSSSTSTYTEPMGQCEPCWIDAHCGVTAGVGRRCVDYVATGRRCCSKQASQRRTDELTGEL